MSILQRASLISRRCVQFFSGSSMPALQHEINDSFEKATFGMGCFWACDSLYGATQGVLRTRVGYSGGTKDQPTYRSLGDHTEVIEIDFNPKEITYEDLLQLFWNNHEYGLTTKVKRQYMSLILYHSDEQKAVAEKSAKDQSSKLNTQLRTEIAKAGTFYPAEDYHQKYRLQRHPKLCEMIGLNAKLLQTSHLAARLNGFLAGLGKEERIVEELKQIGCNEKVVDYVIKEWKSNAGGSLYC